MFIIILFYMNSFIIFLFVIAKTGNNVDAFQWVND